VLILYISIQLVVQGILGGTIAAHKDAPLAAVAGIIFGKAGIILILIVTAISMLGNLGGEILSIPRILFAGARDGLMPKILGRVHPKFFTPHIAILFYASLGFLFAISGGFKQLAVIATASTLLIYLGVVLSTLKLRKNNSAISEKTFRVPGGMIIPLLATCVIIWLLTGLTKPEFIGIAIFIAVFSLIYLLIKWIKKKQSV
jgi:APA family basic amino acid/polyamine antiporter